MDEKKLIVAILLLTLIAAVLAEEEDNNTSSDGADHKYYKSLVSSDLEDLWVDLTEDNDTITLKDLSSAYRRVVPLHLSFQFPFYGHTFTRLSASTGGFLHVGDFDQPSIFTQTHYVAPLMADFIPLYSDDTNIRYLDNGTALIVEWERIHLQGDPNIGSFTFETILLESGDIYFLYKSIPIDLSDIPQGPHPIKVGVSDAYKLKRRLFTLEFDFVYVFHELNISFSDIRNDTVVKLMAKDTCIVQKDCLSCLTPFDDFQCEWCPKIGRCSNLADRMVQEWLTENCHKESVKSLNTCSFGDEHNLSDVVGSDGTTEESYFAGERSLPAFSDSSTVNSLAEWNTSERETDTEVGGVQKETAASGDLEGQRTVVMGDSAETYNHPETEVSPATMTKLEQKKQRSKDSKTESQDYTTRMSHTEEENKARPTLQETKKLDNMAEDRQQSVVTEASETENRVKISETSKPEEPITTPKTTSGKAIKPRKRPIPDHSFSDSLASASVEKSVNQKEEEATAQREEITLDTIVGICIGSLMITALIGLIGWTFYAYRNPTSAPGLMLINMLRGRPPLDTSHRNTSNLPMFKLHEDVYPRHTEEPT